MRPNKIEQLSMPALSRSIWSCACVRSRPHQRLVYFESKLLLTFFGEISVFSLSRLFCFRRWQRTNARGCLLQVASVIEIWPSCSLLHQTVSYGINIIIVVVIVITFGVAVSLGWCKIFKDKARSGAYEQEHATPLYFCHGVFIDRFIFKSNLL